MPHLQKLADLLQDVGDDEQQRQDRRFRQDRPDQRPRFEPPRQPHLLGQQHHLPQHGGVDDGEAVEGVGDAMLAEYHVLEQGEEAEQHPQIQEHHGKAPNLVPSGLFRAVQVRPGEGRRRPGRGAGVGHGGA